MIGGLLCGLVAGQIVVGREGDAIEQYTMQLSLQHVWDCAFMGPLSSLIVGPICKSVSTVEVTFSGSY